MKLWRVEVVQDRSLEVYAEADTADDAAEAVRDEFSEDWFEWDSERGIDYLADSTPIIAVAEQRLSDLIVHPGRGDVTVAEWMERHAALERTAGTPEYRAAVEAAGQLTLDPTEGGRDA